MDVKPTHERPGNSPPRRRPISRAMSLSRSMHRARAGLADDSGMAMIMAVIVTVILLALVGAAVAVTSQSGGATTRDDNVKAADEAVEAGLRAATYRLNQIQPTDANCINSGAAVSPTSDGTCHGSSETLGNGATFTYYTTPSNISGSSCVGYTVSSSSVVAQRCITVQATSNGVMRRAQVRIASYEGTPLFPAYGLVGLNGISIDNQAYINGSTASNATITLNNQSLVVSNGSNSVQLGPSGHVTTLNGGSYPSPALQRTAQQGPFTLSPVDPGNSASVNDDGRITNGMASPPTSPYDSSTGCPMGNASGSCWNPTYRTLNLNNHAALTLGGGVYNFCSLSINNGSTLTIANGARVAIYIDSGASGRSAASGCPTYPTTIANGGSGGSGGYSGYFNLDNQGVINNPSQDPTALVIYIYDNTGQQNNSDGMLHENNQGVIYGTIYAPQSWFHLNNQAGIVGGVAAAQLTVDNQFHYTWDNRDSSLVARTAGVYFRTAWKECQPTAPNANDPQSGC